MFFLNSARQLPTLPYSSHPKRHMWKTFQRILCLLTYACTFHENFQFFLLPLLYNFVVFCYHELNTDSIRTMNFCFLFVAVHSECIKLVTTELTPFSFSLILFFISTDVCLSYNILFGFYRKYPPYLILNE